MEKTNIAEMEYPVQIDIKTLFNAGAHYGHQKIRWNPKMLPFIYGERNGIHIINLDLTMKAWARARQYIVDRVSGGANVLFVGTKQQAREIIETEARRCGAFFITSRWLGGTLTNFATLKKSIDRMNKLDDLLVKASAEDSNIKIGKKEKLGIMKQLDKLDARLGGIRNMRRAPDLIFIIDIMKEDIAISEAKKLHIPVMALVDTNCNPNEVDFAIPSNDDAARTIRLFAAGVADAILEGRQIYESRMPKEKPAAQVDSNIAVEMV